MTRDDDCDMGETARSGCFLQYRAEKSWRMCAGASTRMHAWDHRATGFSLDLTKINDLEPNVQWSLHSLRVISMNSHVRTMAEH
jgi:hypothetical protein